jgi:hypothetical protein
MIVSSFLLQFNDHLANILSLEKTYESSYCLVYTFHHCLFVFQFTGFEVATSLVKFAAVGIPLGRETN